MKKTKLFWIFGLLITLACLLLASCAKGETVSSIGLKGNDPTLPIEMPIGVFDYQAQTLVVTYDSGRVEELALTEEMIVEADLFKFYQEGEHEVSLTYGGRTYGFRISVKRGGLGTVRFPEQNVFVYDGSAHTVEIEGELPANAVVTYPGGNSFVNAGTYSVTAIVTCEGYVTETATTTVTVRRATYDMQGVRFDAKEVVYDGNEHRVEISGTLPEGVLPPTYYINDKKTAGATDAGEYTVVAVFSNSNPNYETIPDMQTTLCILPAEYSLPALSLVFRNEDGSPIDGVQKVYDAMGVRFELVGRDSLSSKIKLSYTVCDEAGAVIASSNTATNIKDAGVYTVTVDFALADSDNYHAIQPLVARFEITKASYDLSEVHFDSDLVIYDGQPHSLGVLLPAELGLTAEDITYEYYLDGERLLDTGVGVTEAGKYTVKARFAVKDENYLPIPEMQATLIIEQKVIDISSLGFEGRTSLLYTGESQTVGFRGLPLEHLTYETVLYRIDGSEATVVTEAREIGTYRCVITVRTASANCILSTGGVSREFSCDFEIVNAAA